MVVARMAQPRPVKIETPARPPMVGRVVDEHIPQVPGDEARRRRSPQVESECRPQWACNCDQTYQHARPGGRADQVLRRMMVALVNP